VYEHYQADTTVDFYYMVKFSENNPRETQPVTIEVRDSKNSPIFLSGGTSDRVSTFASKAGEYKICFTSRNDQYQPTIIGIEMLGEKSETHWHHAKFDEMAQNENLRVLQHQLMKLGRYLDEMEAVQSLMENNNDQQFVLGERCQSQFALSLD